MVVHIVVCVVQGCAESAQAFTDRSKADEAEAEARRILNMPAGEDSESENCIEVFYNVPVK